jgi:hypothetical protein
VIGSLSARSNGILPDLLDKSDCRRPTRWSERHLQASCSAPSSAIGGEDGGDPSFSGLMLVFALLCWGRAC